MIDRQLNPGHLFSACPDLRRLHVDWELSDFNVLDPAWFGHVLADAKWAPVAARLSRLDLVLPAAHRAPHEHAFAPQAYR